MARTFEFVLHFVGDSVTKPDNYYYYFVVGELVSSPGEGYRFVLGVCSVIVT